MQVPLHATRCFHAGGPKSPFPHLALKSGAMHFRFMQVRGRAYCVNVMLLVCLAVEQDCKQCVGKLNVRLLQAHAAKDAQVWQLHFLRYTVALQVTGSACHIALLLLLQADEARRRTRIADLHLHRQVVAVLGLLHCPLLEDLAAAHTEFGRSAK
jgi:hypothetical protein